MRLRPRKKAKRLVRPRPGRGGPRRLPPDERAQLIAKAAVRFFAEYGFEGQTRELARRLGITQPLLYRYFPSKEALIERVYQEVFAGVWKPQWETLLEDRRLPLRERLLRFYHEYTDAMLTYEWVRLFMFSGLKGLDFNARYLTFLREAVFSRVVAELRHAYGRPSPAELPIAEAEVEIVWSLHAGLFYLGVRRWIYGLPIPDDIGRVVAERVTAFLDGAPALIARAEPPVRRAAEGR
ncbi:MAG TPA: helix-turn-helix domain-containing protein [Stellaceae bacterium]|nr:helix-turn-helix domain-containing protein [Stellaceae bacterium]